MYEWALLPRVTLLSHVELSASRAVEQKVEPTLDSGPMSSNPASATRKRRGRAQSRTSVPVLPSGKDTSSVGLA